MKKIIALLAFCVLVAVAISKWTSKPSANYVQLLNNQKNPFMVHQDSAVIVWQRAHDFLSENKRIVAGGKKWYNDSIIKIPYASSYEKGNAIQIQRRKLGDSVWFYCEWWYSRIQEPKGGKEIALFMQYGVGRYQ